MNSSDEMLRGLFRAASNAQTDNVEMPFGFDIRVLALARAPGRNGSGMIAILAQRAAAVAIALLVAATTGLYYTAVSNGDIPSEYAIADSAIETHLSE